MVIGLFFCKNCHTFETIKTFFLKKYINYQRFTFNCTVINTFINSYLLYFVYLHCHTTFNKIFFILIGINIAIILYMIVILL